MAYHGTRNIFRFEVASSIPQKASEIAGDSRYTRAFKKNETIYIRAPLGSGLFSDRNGVYSGFCIPSSESQNSHAKRWEGIVPPELLVEHDPQTLVGTDEFSSALLGYHFFASESDGKLCITRSQPSNGNYAASIARSTETAISDVVSNAQNVGGANGISLKYILQSFSFPVPYLWGSVIEGHESGARRFIVGPLMSHTSNPSNFKSDYPSGTMNALGKYGDVAYSGTGPYAAGVLKFIMPETGTTGDYDASRHNLLNYVVDSKVKISQPLNSGFLPNSPFAIDRLNYTGFRIRDRKNLPVPYNVPDKESMDAMVHGTTIEPDRTAYGTSSQLANGSVYYWAAGYKTNPTRRNAYAITKRHVLGFNSPKHNYGYNESNPLSTDLYGAIRGLTSSIPFTDSAEYGKGDKIQFWDDSAKKVIERTIVATKPIDLHEITTAINRIVSGAFPSIGSTFDCSVDEGTGQVVCTRIDGGFGQRLFEWGLGVIYSGPEPKGTTSENESCTWNSVYSFAPSLTTASQFSWPKMLTITAGTSQTARNNIISYGETEFKKGVINQYLYGFGPTVFPGACAAKGGDSGVTSGGHAYNGSTFNLNDVRGVTANAGGGKVYVYPYPIPLVIDNIGTSAGGFNPTSAKTGEIPSPYFAFNDDLLYGEVQTALITDQVITPTSVAVSYNSGPTNIWTNSFVVDNENLGSNGSVGSVDGSVDNGGIGNISTPPKEIDSTLPDTPIEEQYPFLPSTAINAIKEYFPHGLNNIFFGSTTTQREEAQVYLENLDKGVPTWNYLVSHFKPLVSGRCCIHLLNEDLPDGVTPIAFIDARRSKLHKHEIFFDDQLRGFAMNNCPPQAWFRLQTAMGLWLKYVNPLYAIKMATVGYQNPYGSSTLKLDMVRVGRCTDGLDEIWQPCGEPDMGASGPGCYWAISNLSVGGAGEINTKTNNMPTDIQILNNCFRCWHQEDGTDNPLTNKLPPNIKHSDRLNNTSPNWQNSNVPFIPWSGGDEPAPIFTYNSSGVPIMSRVLVGDNHYGQYDFIYTNYEYTITGHHGPAFTEGDYIFQNIDGTTSGQPSYPGGPEWNGPRLGCGTSSAKVHRHSPDKGRLTLKLVFDGRADTSINLCRVSDVLQSLPPDGRFSLPPIYSSDFTLRCPDSIQNRLTVTGYMTNNTGYADNCGTGASGNPAIAHTRGVKAYVYSGDGKSWAEVVRGGPLSVAQAWARDGYWGTSDNYQTALPLGVDEDCNRGEVPNGWSDVDDFDLNTRKESFTYPIGTKNRTTIGTQNAGMFLSDQPVYLRKSNPQGSSPYYYFGKIEDIFYKIMDTFNEENGVTQKYRCRKEVVTYSSDLSEYEYPNSLPPQKMPPQNYSFRPISAGVNIDEQEFLK